MAAFDSGNLMDVAQAYRERDPERTIIIAGDNDHHLPRRDVPLPNVGREKAEATAAAVGGVAVIPDFAVTDKGSDWNDYAAQHGRAVVRQAVETVLRDQGIVLPAERQSGAGLTQAARDAARQQASAGQRSQTAAQTAAAEAARRRAVQRTGRPRV